MTKHIVLGIDLSGPTNVGDTAVVIAQDTRTGLRVDAVREGLDDHGLRALLDSLDPRATIVGLDAPLSYEPGGGDRVAERSLRAVARAVGLPAGSVMTPTMTRMAYLTLRGIVVARLIERMRPSAMIVEVHPATALALRGAPVADLIAMKSSPRARARIAAWCVDHGCTVDPDAVRGSDHRIAALGAALAARDWARGTARWEHPADPPLHPFAVCA